MTNTERVKEMYAAFAQGEIAAIMDALADDVEWDFEAPAAIPFGGKRRGRAEAQGFFTGIGATEENQVLTMTEFIESGNHVATFGRYAATAKSTGIRYDTPAAHFWEFRDGKVVKYTNYSNTALAADAHTSAAAAAAR